MLTSQEIFNRVWDEFVTQGKPLSVSSGGQQCRYRGTNGSKCAFGIFIPDDRYSPEMENKGASRVIEQWDLQEFRPFKDIMNRLQLIHDVAAGMYGDSAIVPIKEGLKNYAEVQGFKIPS